MWGRFLASRWCIPVAALVGMLLIAPAMNMGLMGDDYLHWSLLTGRSSNPQPGSFFGLFTFSNGSPTAIQAMIDSGQLVWWSSTHLKIAFWRPLAELSQWLDYAIWPDSPILQHIHSLILYGVMILLVGKLYRELDDDRERAGLAVVLFAGNMLHAFAVAWLACRNQMLSGILLALTLLAYHRWRSGQSAIYGVLAAISLSLGLFSAEASVQIAGFLLAYALFMENDKPLRTRLVALLPFVIIVLVWKATHGHLGYGSAGSPGYVDPSGHLGRFISSVSLRLPALMLAQWLGVSSMAFEQLDRPTQVLYSGAGTVALAGVAYLIYYLGGFRSALVRFLAAGSLLSLVPACAGYTFDRLTVNSDVGASGVLAALMISVWRERQQLRGWAAGTAKNLMLLIGFIHLVVFPIGKLASSAMMGPLTRASEVLGALALPDAPAGQTQHMLLLNLASAEGIYYMPLTRQYHGRPNPSTMRALGPSNQAMTLTRVDEQTLRVTAPAGFRSNIARDMVLEPFKVGDVAHMGNVAVRVDEVTPDHAPKAVSYRFPDSLDLPHWHMIAWSDTGVHTVKAPAVGQSVELPSYDIAKAVMQYVGEHH
jgi:hypothetical protein